MLDLKSVLLGVILVVSPINFGVAKWNIDRLAAGETLLMETRSRAKIDIENIAAKMVQAQQQVQQDAILTK